MKSMSTIAGASFLLAGILAMVGTGVLLWSYLGPRPPAPPAPRPAAWPTTPPATVTAAATAVGVPAELSALRFTDALPVDSVPWFYDGIDFGKEQTVMVALEMGVGDDPKDILITFMPHVWTPEIFAGGIFDADRPDDHGVVWEDDAGRTGLWLHSGAGEVMFPLQEWLERDGRGYFRRWDDAQAFLDQYVVGRRVHVWQGEGYSLSRIRAAVRIGPRDVAGVQAHVMDLAEYAGLAGRLTGSPEALLLFFCGRLLNGEGEWMLRDESPWMQARYVIALVPER